MIKRALVSLFALVLLSACGYRGALTLPQDAPEETTTQNAPAENQNGTEDK
jgi:predicted small lipoprotein YifL